jgi:hypothetical protein
MMVQKKLLLHPLVSELSMRFYDLQPKRSRVFFLESGECVHDFWPPVIT